MENKEEIGMAFEIFADLHNHTFASDGDFSPVEMVAAGESAGIRFLGITDHDTLDGLVPALARASESTVTVVPGVEVSLCFKRPHFTGTLHLLCYFNAHRLGDDEFVQEFSDLLSQGRGRALVTARMEKINHWFGPRGKQPLMDRDMTPADLAPYGDRISRRHFALALEEKLGIGDGARRNTILANKSPAYLPSGIPLSKMADFIDRGGILPILAHPAAGSFPGEGHYKEVLPPLEVVEGLLPELLDAGVRGLEVHYPGHTPELESRLMTIARERNLLVTGGSDCHGDAQRPAGVAGMSREEFERFEQALNTL